jgi:hypothetical protein
MILIITIDSSCDPVSSACSSDLWLTLRDTTFVSIDQLVLGSIVRVIRVME